MNYKWLIGLLPILFIGITSCENEVESINVIEPKRDIDTNFLKNYKSNLESRNIAVGAIYDWGVKNEGNLMQTPDSLDLIIVKENYKNLTEHQKSDLKKVQEIKATKVVIGLDLNKVLIMLKENYEKELAKRIADKEKEIELAGDVLSKAKKDEIFNKIISDFNEEYKKEETATLDKFLEEGETSLAKNNFDGISVELPEIYESKEAKEGVVQFLEKVSSNLGKEKIFMIENPVRNVSVNERANWLIGRKMGGSSTLAYYEDMAGDMSGNRYLASVDFSEDGLDKGYSDSKVFLSTGKLNKIIDVTNWSSDNKGGVVFYHIEKNYTDIKGNNTYSTLKSAIYRLQQHK